MEKLNKETIRIYARTLRMPTFNQYTDIITELGPDEGYEEFLIKLMEREIESRTEKKKAKKIKEAHFPYIKTFEELELDRFEQLSEAFLRELSTCRFIEDHKNLVMIGNPGTGKTHLAIALGICACNKGYTVRFTRVGDLVDAMSEARNEKQLLGYMRKLSKADLLILDEVGFTQLTRDQSDLLFKVISSRSEINSIIVTTNYTFSDWAQFFSDDTQATAIAGRLTYRSHVLDMNSEHPYREEYSVLPNETEEEKKEKRKNERKRKHTAVMA